MCRTYQATTSVDRFNIKTNTWDKITRMNTLRELHSSCSQGDATYVFFGWTVGHKIISSIEQLKSPEKATIYR